MARVNEAFFVALYHLFNMELLQTSIKSTSVTLVFVQYGLFY